MTSPLFDYILTVHNKEGILQRVLEGLGQCASRDSRIIIVLDGCNDRSPDIVRGFALKAPCEVITLETPDVHEIRSINAGLEYARDGFCVLVQDDVIIQEPDLEKQVGALRLRHNCLLGYLSFRLGANLRRTTLWEQLKHLVFTRFRHWLPITVEKDLAGSPHEQIPSEIVPYGYFERRMIGIKSPVCIMPELRKIAPRLDEQFAPYCNDDADLSLQALKAGLENGVYPIRFQSELEWGGTRHDPSFEGKPGRAIRFRNRRRLWQKHGAFIQQISKASL